MCEPICDHSFYNKIEFFLATGLRISNNLSMPSSLKIFAFLSSIPFKLAFISEFILVVTYFNFLHLHSGNLLQGKRGLLILPSNTYIYKPELTDSILSFFLRQVAINSSAVRWQDWNEFLLRRKKFLYSSFGRGIFETHAVLSAFHIPRPLFNPLTIYCIVLAAVMSWLGKAWMYSAFFSFVTEKINEY